MQKVISIFLLLSTAFALRFKVPYNIEIDNLRSDQEGTASVMITYMSSLAPSYENLGTLVKMRCEKIDKIRCFNGRKPIITLVPINYQIYAYFGGIISGVYYPVAIEGIFTKAYDEGSYYYVCASALANGNVILSSEDNDFIKAANNPSFIFLEVRQICR